MYVIYYKRNVSIAPLIMRVHKVTVTFNFLARRPDTLITIFLHIKGRFIVFISQSPSFQFINYTLFLDVRLSSDLVYLFVIVLDFRLRLID